MKGGSQPLGYTIIEVMIVLAISAVMFLIAASFISGKQERTAFTIGTNGFASQLQEMIAQVENGQYSDISFSCTYDQATNTFALDKTAPPPPNQSNQGTNSECDFLGKFAHFAESPNPSSYEIFSIAGARLVNTLNAATPIAPPYSSGGLDLTVQQTTPQSLQVLDVKVTDTSGNMYTTYGIGFMQSQGSASCDTGECATAAQSDNMVFSQGLDGGGAQNLTESEAATKIDDNFTVASSADICLTDGTQYANIDLGDSGNNSSPFTVTVNVIPKPYVVTPPC